MAEFVTVATTDEIPPGERLVVGVGRKWIAIFNVDGTYYAIADVCTHDDGPLAEGELHDCVITCPRHGAEFDIKTGKVLKAPAMVDVPTYPVRVEGEDIQIEV
ncbi:MAG: non-heme iron oxygenase ferredoxin subunit [Chloroflexi bacterium]|nr:MAG: biphenyl 2,3-dioxygenase [Phototrophicales bacterium]RMF76328.1 MAG: non-heme iron oxygenase ferredoxin subunit [Chloroflexota bacterium]